MKLNRFFPYLPSRQVFEFRFDSKFGKKRTTVVDVDKSTDNAELLSICFLLQYSTPKKVFISERNQNYNTKKEQTLSITFTQYDCFISQNERSLLAIILREKWTRA